MTPEETIPIIAPEFTTPKFNIAGAISIARIQIGDKLLQTLEEDVVNLLIAYLACHIMTVGGRPAGSSGNVSSIQEGATSITYSSIKLSKSSMVVGLSETSYGREYLRILDPYKPCFYIDGMEI